MSTQNQTKTSTIISGGLRRPNWICRNVKQTVILVRDKSGSMSGQKANDASAASLDLVAELAEPANKDGFEVAIIDFSSGSKIVHDIDKATALHGRITPLSTGVFGGSTNITAGLTDAMSILQTATKRNQVGIAYLRPVVLIFTDGCHNSGANPSSVANGLKRIADLVTVAFGSDADEALLRFLASTPQHFYRCSTGRDLRTFLAAVGATMTATMAAGTNATQALAAIQ